MLLAIDIGNTAVKFGIFDGENLTSKFSIPTSREYTADALRGAIGDRMPAGISDAISCSVVPQLEATIVQYIRDNFGVSLQFVNASTDLGFKIDYDPPGSLGPDRLVAAYAAAGIYGAPVCVCSFGTALTIDAVTPGRELLAGMIAPGMELMADALNQRTARLPKVKIQRPDQIFSHSTTDSIRAGVYFGFVAMAQGLIRRVLSELGSDTPVIATGGDAASVAGDIPLVSTVDPHLVLTGLRLIHSKTPAGNTRN